MQIRDALINQAPSLALQRAAAAEIARLDAALAEAVKTLRFSDRMANLDHDQLIVAQAARDEAVRQQMRALDLVSRIRMALGDNGQRMQDELIEHCKALAVQAEGRTA